MTRHYRPPRARSSPLWQCLHDSLESFTTGYYPERFKHLGPLDHSRETALRDSLRCGDLASGFLRVQCPDCDHHYLLPFTCKRRGCCPSCHQRRALDTAAYIRDEVKNTNQTALLLDALHHFIQPGFKFHCLFRMSVHQIVFFTNVLGQIV
ncbi:MAG: transposase zinc-binding domain-containing protein [Opitutales bacterium]